MHLVVQPCSLVVAAICPKVCSTALSLAVLELALVTIGVSKDILTFSMSKSFKPASIVHVSRAHFEDTIARLRIGHPVALVIIVI